MGRQKTNHTHKTTTNHKKPTHTTKKTKQKTKTHTSSNNTRRGKKARKIRAIQLAIMPKGNHYSE